MLNKVIALSIAPVSRALKRLRLNNPHYWIAVVSLEHAKKAEQGSFIQVCHGKRALLERLSASDQILIYAPREQLRGKRSYQKFVALGTVLERSAYQVKMFEGFTPFRRDVIFEGVNHVDIKPLLPQLSFIKNKQSWGMSFRRGLFEIPKSDFIRIISKMVKK